MAKIILLTGFLGAGKTTMLQSLLDAYAEHRIGLVVNEFGEVNIDAQLVKRDGIEMAELSNGSIFCACIKDKFVDSLVQLSAANLEYLFIEASGLADPANMETILDGIKHKLANPYELCGSICVVDAVHFTELLDLLPALERQVAYANAVVINKADLASEDEIEEVKRAIRELNSGAKMYVTSYCRVEIQDVIGDFVKSEIVSQESTNTFESRPNAFVLHADEVLSYEGLKAFVSRISEGSYRVKGFAVTDQGNFEISAVMQEVSIKPWDEDCQTEIVAISSVGMKLLSMITAASAELLEGKLKL